MIEIKRARPQMCSGCLCDPDATEAKWYDVRIRTLVITMCDECLKEMKNRIDELCKHGI
jgi:hypothetical protein